MENKLRQQVGTTLPEFGMLIQEKNFKGWNNTQIQWYLWSLRLTERKLLQAVVMVSPGFGT